MVSWKHSNSGVVASESLTNYLDVSGSASFSTNEVESVPLPLPLHGCSSSRNLGACGRGSLPALSHHHKRLADPAKAVLLSAGSECHHHEGLSSDAFLTQHPPGCMNCLPLPPTTIPTSHPRTCLPGPGKPCLSLTQQVWRQQVLFCSCPGRGHQLALPPTQDPGRSTPGACSFLEYVFPSAVTLASKQPAFFLFCALISLSRSLLLPAPSLCSDSGESWQGGACGRGHLGRDLGPTPSLCPTSLSRFLFVLAGMAHVPPGQDFTLGPRSASEADSSSGCKACGRMRPSVAGGGSPGEGWRSRTLFSIFPLLPFLPP